MKRRLAPMMAALATLLLARTATANRAGRGFFTDMAGLFDGFGEMVDDLQERASEEVERLKPALREADSDLDVAMDSLKSAFDRLADSFGSGPGFEFGSIDPLDGQEIVESSSSVSERVERPPSTGVRVPDVRMPPLFSAFRPHVTRNDPLSSIFGFAFKKPWYKGPNVCVTRKIFEEDPTGEDESKEGGEEGEKSALKEESDPNAEVEVIRDGKSFFQFSSTIKSCNDGPNFHECKTVTSDGKKKSTQVVRYECCYGYSRTAEDTEGCSELTMLTIVETLEGLEAEEFEQMMEITGILNDMPDNVTIFVPSNDAVEDFRHDLEELNAVMISRDDDVSGKENDEVVYNVDDGFSYRRKKREALGPEKLAEIIKSHMVQGFVSTNDVRDEDMIQTLGQNKLRITIYNTYPEKVVMANCARVTSRDHYATNGIAHIVDKVILPATQTVADILSQDVQLRTLNKVLRKNNLIEKLSDEQGQFTLFAPTDEAFEKLDTLIRLKMMRGNGCGQDILNNHILPNVICSGVIESKAKSVNSINKYLTLDKDENTDVFTVNDVRVITRDVMATNGVIHVIDEVLVPETAVTIGKALESQGRTTLKDLLDLAGLTESLNDLTNVTMFAPSEKALNTAFSQEFLEDLKQDQQKLRDFLMMHVVSPKKCLCELSDNMLLKTGVEGKKIRINKYPSSSSGSKYPLPLEIIGLAKPTFTAQCARINPKETEVCGGILHSIDKPLRESAPSIMDILKKTEIFKDFAELIETAQMEAEIEELTGGEGEGDSVTIFAPTNAAFSNLGPEVKKGLFEDKERAAKTVRGHVLHNFLCCAGIRRRNPFFNTATRVMLNKHARVVRKSRGDRFYVDDAEITECDKVADNGVVHAVDQVFVPRSNRVAESRRTNLRRILDLIAEF